MTALRRKKMQRTEFIEKVYECSKQANIAIPVSVVIAQAALESAWGESGLTKYANALFGIKATSSWNGKTYNAKTCEVYDNEVISIKADFRAYDSYEQSIADHSNFLRNNSRYSKVITCTDPYICADELKNAGYATDPSYASKLKQIITNYNLREYDKKWAAEKQNATEHNGKIKNIQIIANPGDTINIQVIVTSNN